MKSGDPSSPLWGWLAAAVGRMRWSSLAVCGTLIGWIAGRILRIRRRQVEDAMRRAGVESPSVEACAMYRSLGTSVCECLWLAVHGDAASHHVSIEPSSRARWNAARAMKRGVVIAASHTGNWELAASAIAKTVELLVVVKRLGLRSLDRFWHATRARQGIVLSSGDGALVRARAVLRRGGAVAMMIDQVPVSPRHATRVGFLERPAWVDRAAAALSARTGAPLVIAAARRDRSGEHVLEVLGVLVPPARAGRAWVEDAIREATQRLDRFVRSHPSQWLWLHRRWREPRQRPFDRAVPTATLPGPWKIPSSSPVERSGVV